MEINNEQERTPRQDWEVLKKEYYALIDSKAGITLNTLYDRHTKKRKDSSLSPENPPHFLLRTPSGFRVREYGLKDTSEKITLAPLLAGSIQTQEGRNTVILCLRFDQATGREIYAAEEDIAYTDIKVQANSNEEVIISTIYKGLFDPREKSLETRVFPRNEWDTIQQDGGFPVEKALKNMYEAHILSKPATR